MVVSFIQNHFISVHPAPTSQEMDMCLCIKSLNLHSFCKVLTKFSDNLPTSLPGFLCKDFRSPLNNDTNLHEHD